MPDYTPPDPEMAMRWLQTLEQMTLPVVRARLANSDGGSAAVITGLGTEHITKGFVESWVREQELAIQKGETQRYRTVLIWTIVAAVAGIIAAVTGIISVIR
jgi:hypothetical protein